MIIDKIKQVLGLESAEEKLQRYEQIQKAFVESDAVIDELAKDFFIEKNLKEQRLQEPDNYTIQDKINQKYDLFIKSHKTAIVKAKRQYESLKKEKEQIEKSLDSDIKKGSILGKVGDEFIENLSKVLKNKKETAYSKIKKAYQQRQITLESFNTIIKGITKQEKTRYSDFIILNEKGELLLLQRSKWEDPNKGAWVLPGGHVDPGEDHETAAKRELAEEAGLSVEQCENVGSYEDDKSIIEYYQAEISSDEKAPVLQWEEARDFKWVPMNEIREEPMIFNMCENVMRILGLVNRHKEVIRKAILEGIIPLEMVIKKAKDIRDSSYYKENLERLEARRTDKQYSKEKAGYVDSFKEGDHVEENSCDRCEYYRPKEKDNCVKVKGDISHNGHCKFFEYGDTEKSLDSDIEKAEVDTFIKEKYPTATEEEANEINNILLHR